MIENRDCIPGNDLAAIWWNVVGCKGWCNRNPNCGGFVLRRHNAAYACFFKNLECKNGITNSRTVDLYLKSGNKINSRVSSKCYLLQLLL